jgi:hypothetical protein
MYRAMALRVECDRCARNAPLEQMSITGGGHRCWYCEVAQQIERHRSGGASAQMTKDLSAIAASAFGLLALLGLAYFALGILMLLAHPC